MRSRRASTPQFPTGPFVVEVRGFGAPVQLRFRVLQPHSLCAEPAFTATATRARLAVKFSEARTKSTGRRVRTSRKRAVAQNVTVVVTPSLRGALSHWA